MDYENKPEVIEWARRHWEEASDVEKKHWEFVFPVLAESEDERIRKYIVKFVEIEKGVNLSPDDADKMIAYLKKQKEQKPEMIRWTGDNLKDVIDFTGKSPKFGEWFKSWDEYEEYVHSHNDILKLFCEDGSHYEVPKGAWIVKTPDGYNVASRSKFIQKPAEWSEEDENMIRFYEMDYNNQIGDWPAKKVIEMRLAFKDWLCVRLKSLRPRPHWKPSDQ